MGGNAIQGVRRVTGDEARATLPPLRMFLEANGIAITMLIGSAWDRTEGSSGDLDVGTAFPPAANFTATMSAKIGKIVRGKAMPGISVYSFGFPIMGQAANGTVQVDLMPVYYPEWSQFVYSTQKPGKTKSAHRNCVLWSLAKSSGVQFDIHRGALRSAEHTTDPGVFLKWLGLSAEDAASYETLAAKVSPPVLYEAGVRLAAVR